MRDVIIEWTGSDADLLTELNAPQFKVVVGDGPQEGMVTLLMIGSLDSDGSIAANLNYTLDEAIKTLENAADIPTVAQGRFMRQVYKRLTESSNGADLSNDATRAGIGGILLAAGWTQGDIDLVLSLGAYFESYADRELGRVATQADVDLIRANHAQESAVEAVENRANLAIEAAQEAQRAGQTPSEIESAAETAWSA